MPYISAQETREIKKALKKALPNLKLSVRNSDHTSVCVTIKEGDIDFGTQHLQVNHYYISQNWEDKPEAEKVLSKIVDTINDCKSRKTVHVDADYGSIPNYYIDLSIGGWCTPYVCKAS